MFVPRLAQVLAPMSMLVPMLAPRIGPVFAPRVGLMFAPRVGPMFGPKIGPSYLFDSLKYFIVKLAGIPKNIVYNRLIKAVGFRFYAVEQPIGLSDGLFVP